MRIKSVELKSFKRFLHLQLELPETPKLVVLCGPNGCGKSSLFEAFNTWHRIRTQGLQWDPTYHLKTGESTPVVNQHQGVQVQFHGEPDLQEQIRKKVFYFRSAYRNDPSFRVDALNRQPPLLDVRRFNYMIDNDVAVGPNYQRLASQALEELFATANSSMTIAEFRESIIGAIRDSMKRVFPDLVLNDLSNPLESGTFRFDKGTSTHFEYKNLSGGEKAAFDLLLDLLVRRTSFNNTVFCIDEPEAHMNTRLQATLLEELVRMLPNSDCQLWIATHAIGMLRRARDMELQQPNTVAFVDFANLDFDQPQALSPTTPNRVFWERTLTVALDDLSSLVAPAEVVLCEGSPKGTAGKNVSHDARCYNTIFESEFPDTTFLSAGNWSDVESDRLALLSSIRGLVKGCKVVRLIDGDDHAPTDIAHYRSQGIRVLTRRQLESFLYDDEILSALCEQSGQQANCSQLLEAKRQALADVVAQGKPADDLKSAAGMIYVSAKKLLNLTNVGNDALAFARNTLAPLVTPTTQTYQELRAAIFGVPMTASLPA